MNGSFAYVQRSIDAVVRLALRDTGALSQLDMTADGFFRSFSAMIVGAPLFAIFWSGWRHLLISAAIESGQKFNPAELEFDGLEFTFSALVYLLPWFVFPIAALLMLRFLQQTERYSALVIAYNWSALLVMAALNVPVALFQVGLVGTAPTFALLFTVFGLSLYYRFFVAGTALQSDTSTAMAITTVNAMLLFFIWAGAISFTALLAGGYG
jgi:hypothetical protein